MEFKVTLTIRAQLDFRNIINYILHELRSEQAATSVANDMEYTIERLSYTAGGLKLCDDPTLRALGYRTIHFKHHRYFMLYRIQDGVVTTICRIMRVFQSSHNKLVTSYHITGSQ